MHVWASFDEAIQQKGETMSDPREPNTSESDVEAYQEPNTESVQDADREPNTESIQQEPNTGN